jgi:hypothetical protein
LQDLGEPGTATFEQGEFGSGGRALGPERRDAGLRVLDLWDRDDLPAFDYRLEHAFFAQYLQETIQQALMLAADVEARGDFCG